MWKSFTSEIRDLPYKRAMFLTLIITLGVVVLTNTSNDNIFQLILEPFTIENIEKTRTENPVESDTSLTINSSEMITQADAESINIEEDVIEQSSPIDVNSFFTSNMTEQEARIAYRNVIDEIEQWYDKENTTPNGFKNSLELQNSYNTMIENARMHYNSYLN